MLIRTYYQLKNYIFSSKYETHHNHHLLDCLVVAIGLSFPYRHQTQTSLFLCD